jgi:glutamyl-tRNA reductase
VLHLFRVVAGLDSQVRGEFEILGQVREAYALGASGPVLDRLFHQALHVGRRVRAETLLGQSAASVSSAAAELAGEMAGRKALVIGAGRVGGETAKKLAASAAEVAIANRNVERARRLAGSIGGRAVALEEIPAELAGADVVVSSTASPELVLTRETVEQALPVRSGTPLVVIDLAVPRDVDPRIAELPGCSVYDIDDLPSEELGDSVAEAERIVREEAERFDAWVASRGVAPAIASLRARAEEIRRGELDKAEGRLARLSPADRRAVEALTAQIVNKLLHPPTVRLKEAADDGEGGLYADAVRHLFGLDAHPDRLARQ